MSPNDPSLQSFIDVPRDSDFPIQNLPYGVFSTRSDPRRRPGVAIGDFILDLAAISDAGLLPEAGETLKRATLNPFISLDRKARSGTRARISTLLRHDNPE